MSTQQSTLLNFRFVSDSALQARRNIEKTVDIIDFLAAVQKLELDILPITWQSARLPIGAGGTSRINEAIIDVQTSFAFKCVSDDQKEEGIAKSFQAFISEISILGHPLIQDHPNIVDLEGICWDITRDEVWPVLVFEKSQFGDLYEFLASPPGRALNANERLKLCRSIASALIAMHSFGMPCDRTKQIQADCAFIGMVHGDVKPENVLIFTDEFGDHVPKVMDFGFAMHFSGDEDVQPVPKSRPWHAPEHDFDLYNLVQALKMDVFSFSMLCLWILFEKQLSGVALLPQNMYWAEDYLPKNQFEGQDKHVLKALKGAEKLGDFAQQLIVAEKELDNADRQDMKMLFAEALVHDPRNRTYDLGGYFSFLIPDKYV
jgi:serine/threonine protein kinase